MKFRSIFQLLFLLSSAAFSQNAESDTSRILQANSDAFKLYGVDAPQMMKIGNEMLELSISMLYERGIASSYNTIALAKMSTAEYEKAVQNFLQALEIYERIKAKTYISSVLNNMGVVYYYLEDHQQSLRYHMEALKSREALGDSVQIAKSLNNIGIAYKGLDSLSRALEFYQKSLFIKKSLLDSIGISSTLNNIGNVYLEQEELDKAKDYFMQSLQIDSVSNKQSGIATSYLNLGVVSLKQRNFDQARELFRKAIAVANANDNRQVKMLAFERMSELAEEQSDFKSAFSWNQKWILLKDSLNSIANVSAINELESRYQNEKISIENDLLKEQQKVKDEQISSQRNLIFGGAILAILFILLTFYFVRSYQFKQSLLELTQKKNDEIVKKNKLISSQKEELEELNEIKNKMFSILSHDLKGPFNNLHSVLSMANEGHLDDKEMKDLLQLLAAESNNVKDMITNILEWVKSQMGGLNVIKSEFSLHDMVNDLIPVYQSIAEKKGIEVRNSVDRELKIYADENLTKIVVRNLISNAIKFSNDGIVEITSDFVENEALISVIDSGVGMDSTQIPKIFTDDQFSTQGTSKEEGTGIGLLLVKEFVMKNGGRLNVKSELGLGTTFAFTIPVAPELVH